jgi:hypothetical protein
MYLIDILLSSISIKVPSHKALALYSLDRKCIYSRKRFRKLGAVFGGKGRENAVL